MRYAVYYAPSPRSDFWRAGSSWLGWDAAAGLQVLPPDMPAGLLARLAPLTCAAARYGWHATLKAPFKLAAGIDEEALLAAVAALAQRFAPLDISLQVSTLASFPALRPLGDEGALQELANACVVSLAPLAAPDTRQRAGLDVREATLAARWGYPYVFERYRFHLTLADAVAEPVLATAIAQAARRHFDGLLSLRLAALAVFVQPRADEPFRYLAECGFDGEIKHHVRR